MPDFTVRSAEFFSVKMPYASQHTFAFLVSFVFCLRAEPPIRIRHAPLWMAVLRYSYPFTPPEVRPPMTYCWHSRNTTVIGTPLKTANAENRPHSFSCSYKNELAPTTNVHLSLDSCDVRKDFLPKAHNRSSRRKRGRARRVSGEAFPQGLKLPVRAYDLSQALAIEIRFQALADVSEDECDFVLRQILVQLFESASRRIVNPRDRSRVHDKPAHGGGRFGRQFARLDGEAINVCVEEIRPEPIHQQPRRRHPAGFHSAHLPIAVGCLRFHRYRRLVAVAYMLKQRQHEREQDAVLHAEKDYGSSGYEGKNPLAGALAVEIV